MLLPCKTIIGFPRSVHITTSPHHHVALRTVPEPPILTGGSDCTGYVGPSASIQVGDVNLLNLTYHCLHCAAPPYLSSQPTRVADILSRRRLRSSATDTLLVRPMRLITVGDRAFPDAASKLWNELSGHVGSCHRFRASDCFSSSAQNFFASCILSGFIIYRPTDIGVSQLQFSHKHQH